MVSNQFSVDRSAPEISSLLWREPHCRAANGFRSPSLALGRGLRDFAPAHPHFPSFGGRKASRLWPDRETSERSPLARLHLFLRVLPWRQRQRDRRKPSDRMDWTRREAHRTKRKANLAASFPRQGAALLPLCGTRFKALHGSQQAPLHGSEKTLHLGMYRAF